MHKQKGIGMSNTNKRFTALYARHSKEDGRCGTSNSISQQMSIMHDYADEHGFDKIIEYADDGFSGTNFDRPGFITMKEDIEFGLKGIGQEKKYNKIDVYFIGVGLINT